jgi:hypothetical protein
MSKTEEVLKLMNEGETDTKVIKQKTGASESLITRCRNRLEKQKYKAPKQEEVKEEEEEPTDENTDIENNENMQEDNRSIAGIQIIDSNTGKKQPSGLDRLLDVVFSEQFAPITFSILDGIAKRLNGTANNEQSEGNFVTTVSGAVIKVPNKEF